MQLSENTITVLKNFSTINPGLFVKQGNVLRTVSKSKTVLAEATIDETMPKDFGVFELNQLLAIISLHKTPPLLDVEGNNLVVRGADGRSRITYRTCDSTMVRVPPDQNIKLPSEDIVFTMNENDYAWILRSASVLSTPNITVTSRDGKLYLGTSDMADDAAHTDALEVGDYKGESAHFVFKAENWLMLPDTYAVTISAKGIAHFQSTTRKIQYWVALESKKA